MKKQFLEAGKIVNTHGVAGELRVQPWADSPDFLLGFKKIYIDGEAHTVSRSRVHGGMVIMKLADVGDINDAMRLKNKVAFIDRNDARLTEGEFFVQDIIGAEVFDEAGVSLGKLSEVLDLPGGNVYVVQGRREILIPAIPEFIISTDAEKGVVTVRLIEGM